MLNDRQALIDSQRSLARDHRAAGHLDDALIADFTALALQADSADMYGQLGHLSLRHGRLVRAIEAYSEAVNRAPDDLALRQGLVAAFEAAGRHSEAAVHRDHILSRQCVFVDEAPEERRRVLILAVAGLGNVPLEAILPKRVNTWILWYVEYAKDPNQVLPPYDLVFNAMGDADKGQSARNLVDQFLSNCTKPVLNLPTRVDPTRRDLLPSHLADLADVIVPSTILVPSALLAGPELDQRLADAGMRLPIMVRPLGSHGGEGILRAESLDQLRAFKTADPQVYLTQYRDTAGPDGYFRKYRMIFANGGIYPYHQAISKKWLVHYFSADMLAEPWKREEEARFLLDPQSTLGPRAYRAVQAIADRLGLDFGGIDFTLSADGQVVVFEANATMAVHLADSRETFPYKHEVVPRIFEAVETMLAARMADAADTKWA
jgi:glutathione synthase/RimK-type ligase-like ATP-grasp enzyme